MVFDSKKTLEQPGATTLTMPAVEVENLTVRFGAYQALAGVSFQIPPGAFMTVLGPNGAGKSTLLKAMLGLVRPAEGHLRLFGKPVGATSPADLAYVPQIKTLDRTFPARSLELVLTGLRRRWPGRPAAEEREQALEVLGRVGAAHLAERPLGCLSGGELQRVYLARGLVRHPRLILLDEPATGIDVVGAANLYDLLNAYQAAFDVTIIMVTHDMEVAFHHATDVLLLGGVQVSFGPPREALTDARLRQAFGHIGHAHAMLRGGAPDA